MINPAENIVNLWLQDQTGCNRCTMNNIVVPKKRGGAGKEIDIISNDGKKYYWTEVQVSPSPFLTGPKQEKLKKLINEAKKKFIREKELYIYNRFKINKIQKEFVYSPKLFSKKDDEEKKYCKKLAEMNIKAISFQTILGDLYNLNYMGYDTTRQYLFLLKKFDW